MGVVLHPWVAESKGWHNEYFECEKKKRHFVLNRFSIIEQNKRKLIVL